MQAGIFHSEVTTKHYADVVLPLRLPQLYTYAVPEEMIMELSPGMRVEVQFGKGKLYAGLVVEVHNRIPDYRVKWILSIIDKTPIIGTKQWTLWKWLSKYYVCSPGEVMNAAFPTNLKLASETRIHLSPLYTEDYLHLSDKEYLVAEALTIQEELTLNDIRQILNQKTVYHLIQTMLEKKIIYLKEELKDKFKPKKIACVKLLEPYLSDETALAEAFAKTKRSEKQTHALMGFLQLTKQQKFVRKQDITNLTGVGSAVLSAVAKKGIWEFYNKEISRIVGFDDDVESAHELTDQQISALDNIKTQFEEKNVILLKGVTGSGKTRVYIELIQEAIARKEQVLYLLPEIGLTTQIISRLKKIFGDDIAVYHSKMSNNERVEIWKAVARGKAIVLGARSALFLPFSNLKLLIVDEEHDASFKQQNPAPRYHGRDAAIYLAHLFGAKTVLGTATPAVETYFNAKRGKYGYVEMSERYGGIEMPHLVVADVKLEMKERKLQAHFTSLLIEALKEALDRGEQAILFQNRRGFAPVLKCGVCDWKQECVHCDVSLTYHKYRNNLQCHYCGYQTQLAVQCPACGTNDLKLEGFGTEKIEDELAIYLPEARIGRMDLDSVRTKNAHAKIINDFEEQRLDILVGTQMVTKGLDFDNVGIVGVISADQLLQFPDFRAAERSFQLMTQVSGRAGRKHKQGKVIIQAKNVSHPVLKEVLDGDFEGFFEREIMERQSFKYPPYTRLIRITLKHKDPKVVNRAADMMAFELKKELGNRVKGPAVPYVARVRGLYLLDIMVKLELNNTYIAQAKHLILKEQLDIQKQKGLTGVRINVDVDPY